MKRVNLTIGILVVLIIFSSCSGSELNNNEISNYNYKVKLVFHPKMTANCDGNYNYPISKSYSYTIDTLDINMTCTRGILPQINATAWEDAVTQSNKTVHVKHLNFINLNPPNSNNEVDKILLDEDVFSYSTSNVNLSTLPNLFIDNNFTGNVVHPEQIALSIKFPNYISNITSENAYNIGSVERINGIYYEILEIN